MNIIKNISVVILILILSTAEHCSAQDSTLFLTPEMFNNHQAIWLDNYNVWLYRNGNDTGWSKMNLNTSNWEHLSPMQISEKLSDPNGKIEGWFRIKIKIDTSLATIPLYLSFQSGNAAANLYVDGKLFQSFGNINVNGAPFKSYTFYNSLKRIFRISLDKNNAHVIAIHFVSYLPTVPLRFLISPGDLGIRVGITGPKFLNVLNDIQTYNPRYSLFWISASATLALLFWLLAFQNRREKNLSLIALCSTFSCLTALVIYDIDNVNFLFGSILILVVLRVLLGFILCLLILFILARVFTNTISRRLIIIVLSLFILEIYSILSHSSLAQAIVYIAFFPAGLYYVISSWKRLKGAQWAIVVGFLCVLGFIVWAGVNIVRYGQPNYNVLSAIFLSFQISLLVYVSIRFREIIREVQNNAQKVVEITEEKRQQALNQQIILQQEVDKQTLDLRQTLQNLKSTQAQLIQQEKMASLGELTAGIAHEIQNPLNFVNNFSEVNTEMVDEATEEADKGNYDEVKNILKDIKDNSEKINLHGKRADGIVKSMLEHSRSSTGIKEPTNINKLADEYLRLAYHGLRAKDKSFNSEMKTDFDESIGKINIVPQDIGRVLLNLYNNAFYACTERSQSAVNQQKDGISNLYQPKVWVSTNKTENSVTITVKDNGGGIPEKVREKIFQPFFTTKPTGSGTGLGLSLSYDIIKAHGGHITVESKEGEGSTFTIQLPLV